MDRLTFKFDSVGYGNHGEKHQQKGFKILRILFFTADLSCGRDVENRSAHNAGPKSFKNHLNFLWTFISISFVLDVKTFHESLKNPMLDYLGVFKI